MLSEIDPMYSKASVLKLDTSRVEAEKDILIFEITGSFLCSVHWIADLAVSSTTMRYEYSLGTCYIICLIIQIFLCLPKIAIFPYTVAKAKSPLKT